MFNQVLNNQSFRNFTSQLFALGLALPMLWACGQDPQSELSIKNGQLVQSYDLASKSTVAVFSPGNSCTGVVIGKRNVLTAAHCKPAVGGWVSFYNGSNPAGLSRSVTRVALRPGVNPAADQLNDSNGKFADIAVLELDSEIPAGYVPAELPLFGYPGNEQKGWMVGRGRHDNRDNPGNILKWLETKTYSSNTNDGHFLVNSSDSDNGDSGGPFYTLNSTTNKLVVHGVLYGQVFEWAMRGKYTSIYHHLGWVLQQINYSGSITASYGVDRPGLDIRGFPVASFDLNVCKQACVQEDACRAYTYVGANIQGPLPMCWIKHTVPGEVGAANMISGIK